MPKIIICLRCTSYERVEYDPQDDSIHCKNCGNFTYAEKMESKFKIGVKEDIRGMKIERDTRKNIAENSISETVKQLFIQEGIMAKKECRRCKIVKSLIAEGLCYKCYEEEFGKKYEPKKHYKKDEKEKITQEKGITKVKTVGDCVSIPIDIDYDKLAEKIAPIVTNMILKRITTKQIVFEIK